MRATGGYPPEIVDASCKFSINGMQMEVDAAATMTGRLRVKKQSESVQGDSPVGDLLVEAQSYVRPPFSWRFVLWENRRPG